MLYTYVAIKHPSLFLKEFNKQGPTNILSKWNDASFVCLGICGVCKRLSLSPLLLVFLQIRSRFFSEIHSAIKYGYRTQTHICQAGEAPTAIRIGSGKFMQSTWRPETNNFNTL